MFEAVAVALCLAAFVVWCLRDRYPDAFYYAVATVSTLFLVCVVGVIVLSLVIEETAYAWISLAVIALTAFIRWNRVVLSRMAERALHRRRLWGERIAATPTGKAAASTGEAIAEFASVVGKLILGLFGVLAGVAGIALALALGLGLLVGVIWLIKTIWYAV